MTRRPQSTRKAVKKAARRSLAKRAVPEASLLPAGLNDAQTEFCLVYITNGFNATKAYAAAYPATTLEAARRSAYVLLTKHDIRVYVSKLLEDRWKPLHMSGDEALARVAMDARSDPREMFAAGKVLSPDEWPDNLANSVEVVKLVDGLPSEVRLVSKASARRTILEVTGKVKGTSDGFDALAAAIREDKARRIGK